MVDINKLKAAVVATGMPYGEAAEKIGMSRKVWYDRMNSKKFDSDEMYKLIKVLGITDPVPIFFADEVTQQVTSEETA